MDELTRAVDKLNTLTSADTPPSLPAADPEPTQLPPPTSPTPALAPTYRTPACPLTAPEPDPQAMNSCDGIPSTMVSTMRAAAESGDGGLSTSSKTQKNPKKTKTEQSPRRIS